MNRLCLHHINNNVLKNIDINVKDKELLMIIGPSGAGKSTLLNVIAGLAPCTGKIIMQGQCVNHLPTYRRKVGYVLQDLYLFPHLTVKKNILLSMKNLNYSEMEKKAKLETLLNRFKLEKLGTRKPQELSGGEKQLAAMARSVACEPAILLLDEPFAHLDFKTAGHIRATFKSLQRELGMTALFVTHDLNEAKELGDRIIMIKNGRVCRTFKKHAFSNLLPGISHAFFKAPQLCAVS